MKIIIMIPCLLLSLYSSCVVAYVTPQDAARRGYKIQTREPAPNHIDIQKTDPKNKTPQDDQAVMKNPPDSSKENGSK